jgi:hypothetical protein
VSIVRTWFDSLDDDLRAGVMELIGLEREPSDEQIAEVVDIAATEWRFEAAGLGPPLRERLQAAIAALEEGLRAADPRHRFLRENEGREMHPTLVAFYETGEHARHQHCALTDLRYAPFPLYVDYDDIAWLRNPDFTVEKIGPAFVPWANLAERAGGDNSECYAHLAIDPATTKVYLLEPSGNPELVADDLDSFLARLRR